MAESKIYELRGGTYLLDEHSGVLIDSAGNYSAKTRGGPRSFAILLRAIADDIEDNIELGATPEVFPDDLAATREEEQ